MSIMDGMEFLAWLAGLCRPKVQFTDTKEPQEYLVQMRTKNVSGGWTSWHDSGLPITGSEADEWLKTSAGRATEWVEHRIVMIPREMR